MVRISSPESTALDNFRESPRAFTIVGAGLTRALKEKVLQALPQCHILASKMDSWQVLRFCKLVGPTILIVDYESLVRLESEQVPAVEYLSAVEVLAICPISGEHEFYTAICAGCSGVLSLDALPGELVAAVKAVSEGDLWYPRAILTALVRKSILRTSMSQKGLTSREAEILRLIGMSKQNQEIADLLFISRETVRWHLRTLYSKIGVKNRSEAQLYSLKHSESLRSENGEGGIKPS
jgi:two-component system, NarL family, response regulator